MNRWTIEWQVQLMNVGEAGWKDDTRETKNMEEGRGVENRKEKEMDR